jgi:hypothetical protein
MNADAIFKATSNYFQPYTCEEKDSFKKFGLGTLKVISYLTVILPLIMFILHATSTSLSGRIYKFPFFVEDEKIKSVAVTVLINKNPSTIIENPAYIEMTEATLQNNLKIDLHLLIKDFKENKNPETILNPIAIEKCNQCISKIKAKEGDRDLSNKIAELKAFKDFWTKFLVFQNTSGFISLDSLNANGFLDKLLQTHPAKSVDLIPKMGPDDMDIAIQKLLPFKKLFNNTEAGNTLITLANEHCNLRGYVEKRVLDQLQGMSFNYFQENLTAYNDQFKNLEDLADLKISDELKIFYNSVKNIKVKDVGILFNPSTAIQFEDFIKNTSLWMKYQSNLDGKKLTTSNFIKFFTELTNSKPKTALHMLVSLGDSTAEEENIKRRAFNIYFNSSVLFLPEQEEDKVGFLESANRLGLFQNPSNHKDALMPEILRIRSTKPAAAFFIIMLEGIEKQLQDHLKDSALLNKICGQIQTMKTNTTYKTWKSLIIKRDPPLVESKKQMIEIFSQIPIDVLSKIQFPHANSLVWLGNIDTTQECQNDCEMHLIEKEIRIRSDFKLKLT